MKVSELVQLLQAFPPDAEVILREVQPDQRVRFDDIERVYEVEYIPGDRVVVIR